MIRPPKTLLLLIWYHYVVLFSFRLLMSKSELAQDDSDLLRFRLPPSLKIWPSNTLMVGTYCVASETRPWHTCQWSRTWMRVQPTKHLIRVWKAEIILHVSQGWTHQWPSLLTYPLQESHQTRRNGHVWVYALCASSGISPVNTEDPGYCWLDWKRQTYLFSIILYFPDSPMKQHSKRHLLDLRVELHGFGNIRLIPEHAIGVRLNIRLDSMWWRSKPGERGEECAHSEVFHMRW